MNILYVNSLEANNKELARQLASANVLIAEQNKLAKERQEWALHTNEVIRSLNQQLAAAIAACKLKDEIIKEVLPFVGTGYARLREALDIQPDDSALRAWLGEAVAKKIKYGALQFLAGYSELPPNTELYYPKELK